MHSNISCTFLVAELKKLRVAASGGQDLSRELARTHQYTLQLERQLRFYLSRGSGEYPLDHFFLLRVCGRCYVCWSKLTPWYASTERAALPYQVSPLHALQGYSGLGETPESLQATAGGAGQGQSFILPPPTHSFPSIMLCPPFPDTPLAEQREGRFSHEGNQTGGQPCCHQEGQSGVRGIVHVTLTPGDIDYTYVHC